MKSRFILFDSFYVDLLYMSDQQSRQYRQGLVRILGQSIIFDWSVPFNKKMKTSIGTGFFIDRQGHFLTSAHVVDDSDKIVVEIPFESKKKFEAEVLGICFDLDIALLRVKNYQPKYHFRLGDSNQVRSGDRVTAIGFPLGKDEVSLTQGVISGRESGALQTDTALNPGNSGGPLIKDNQVIGINFSVYANATNVGFAAPTAHYFVIADELRTGNRHVVRRPMIGFEFNLASQALLELQKFPCGEGGVYVSLIYPNSPAEKIGLKEGDILCSLNGKKIDRHGMVLADYNHDERVSLREVILTLKNHAMVPIEFWNGQRLMRTQFRATPYDLAIRKKYPRYEKVEYEIFGGMIVMELAMNHVMQMRSKLGKYIMPENRFQSKLIITKIFPGSTLDHLKVFNLGDILVSVNDQEVKTLQEYRTALMKPIDRNVVKIVNEKKRAAFLAIDDTIKEEMNLIKTFEYQPTQATLDFMKHFVTPRSTITRAPRLGLFNTA